MLISLCLTSCLAFFPPSFPCMRAPVAAVLTKQHGGGLTSLEINFIRFGSAAVILFLVVPAAAGWNLMRRSSWMQWPSMSPKQILFMMLGVIFASFASPLLGTWALFKIPIAVWNGLGSLGPVWSLPMTWYFKGEKITLRTLGGALLAAVGATLLGIVSKS
mmetsp:Transcript_19907/g.27588  ORF Transcript_19907/g.27588 Transcript_19907/m.27588 type:complete len:161 (-) Transcript_19907:110-592(-)